MSEAVSLALINLAVTIVAAITVWSKAHSGQQDTLLNRKETQKDIALTTDVQHMVNGQREAMVKEIEALKAENACLKCPVSRQDGGPLGTTSINQH